MFKTIKKLFTKKKSSADEFISLFSEDEGLGSERAADLATRHPEAAQTFVQICNLEEVEAAIAAVEAFNANADKTNPEAVGVFYELAYNKTITGATVKVKWFKNGRVTLGIKK